jgi:hypothetical protein
MSLAALRSPGKPPAAPARVDGLQALRQFLHKQGIGTVQDDGIIDTRSLVST